MFCDAIRIGMIRTGSTVSDIHERAGVVEGGKHEWCSKTVPDVYVLERNKLDVFGELVLNDHTFILGVNP